ncbi:ABC transporter ATP-binding protein [Candidatus Sneabacter namystus]|uniref:ABC transporter ATP-binding protein n=1 Tax=Candidatus Sneabacter namystus TaxID=2601646 RepID=A0A5C0ULD6_9RICK|nr:ABC transporter ATP-binding protein [Candidatus Sneabacter namystus]QEK39684.1 ABC transporter ATP-binding protein [Candidatus Sneabacter namystus]
MSDISRIEFSNVCKYHKKKLILNSINFSVQRGEIATFLGANGAGKTTLLSIAANLISHDKGTVTLYDNCEKNIDTITQYRKNIAFCPSRAIFDERFDIYYNIFYTALKYGLSKNVAHANTEHFIKKLDLIEYKHSHPSVLSFGYLQRFSIAKALVHKPSIIILDEPTVGLDFLAKKNLHNIMLSLKQEGKIVLLTTHDLEEAGNISDTLYIIKDGHIAHKCAGKDIASESKKLETLIEDILKEESNAR